MSRIYLKFNAAVLAIFSTTNKWFVLQSPQRLREDIEECCATGMFTSLQLQYAAHWHKKANKHNLLSQSFLTITSFHSVWPISMFQISSFSSVVNVFCKCAIDALFAHNFGCVQRGLMSSKFDKKEVRIDLIFGTVLFLVVSILYFVYFQGVFFSL